jgi:regulator of replication initiation timing
MEPEQPGKFFCGRVKNMFEKMLDGRLALDRSNLSRLSNDVEDLIHRFSQLYNEEKNLRKKLERKYDTSRKAEEDRLKMLSKISPRPVIENLENRFSKMFKNVRDPESRQSKL